MGMVSEFSDFLEEYKVMGLAIAFVIGTALTATVQSLVNNMIMPIIGIFLPRGDWQTATVNIGSAVVGWGSFTSALIDFVLLAFVIFLLSKVLPKGKKPAATRRRQRKQKS